MPIRGKNGLLTFRHNYVLKLRESNSQKDY